MFVNGSGQNEQSYRESSIDASYQVSVHLAKRLQRRRFLEIDQLETRKLRCRIAPVSLYFLKSSEVKDKYKLYFGRDKASLNTTTTGYKVLIKICQI